MKRIRALGVGHVVVLDTPDEWFSPFVDVTISGDAITPIADMQQAENDSRIQSIVQYMQTQGIEFDGVWTFADKSVVLCAQIAHFFWKPGISPDVISKLKNKQILREWLYGNREHLGNNATHVYALPHIELDSVVADDFPIIIKGKETAGKNLIHIVHTPEELEKCVQRYGVHIITLEPYFEWTDIDLNVIVKWWKIEWSWFIENLPALHPWFLEDGSVCHHSLTADEQREIITYMQNILNLSHIETACLHVEFRIRREEDNFSFTLIEINFRMGGVENFAFHLGRDGYDLVRSNLELAFDMKLSQDSAPQGTDKCRYMMNKNIYADKSGILTDVKPPQITDDIIEYLFYAPLGLDCSFPPGPKDDIGWIVAGSSKSPTDVIAMLDTGLEETGVDIVP